jgi:methanogenic corrinoid protein MtbC1
MLLKGVRYGFRTSLVHPMSCSCHAYTGRRNEKEGRGSGRESLGMVVAGTVFGDIHSIGKTMVATLLVAAGIHIEDC